MSSRIETLDARGCEREWRRLELDAARAFLQAQSMFIELHRSIIAVLREDKALFQALQNEAKALSVSINRLRVVMSKIHAASRQAAGQRNAPQPARLRRLSSRFGSS